MDDAFRSSARHQFSLARTLSGLTILLLFALITLPAYAEDLLWPLPEHKAITGGFADTRPDHFHGGLDLHTGTDHVPVLAPADGWIERITVIPPGYGRVLYYRLPDGRTAVFAHLDHFNPVLETMLRDSELVVGTYAVDLLFDKPSPEREFKRGDVLAYSGATGVGPAHFHYEIREGSVQTDPLLYYGPHDDLPPVIVSVRWTTLSGFTPGGFGQQISGGKGKKVRPVLGGTIDASEPIAFYIQAYDPGPWGRNATPYIMRVKVNDLPVFEDTTARIDLAGPRDIYEKTVWPFGSRNHLDLWRLFSEPPPAQYLDSTRDKRGWLSNLDRANVTIEVQDRGGNTTSASFTVTSGAWPRTGGKPLPAELRAGDFCLNTKADPVAAWAEITELSRDEIHIGPAGFAFSGKTKLCHCLAEVERGSGAYVYERQGNHSRAQWPLFSEGGDTLSCQILRGGTYAVGFDHNPPDLTLLVKSGSLAFKLTDDLSGIDYTTIRCTVDRRTAIAQFEYDKAGGSIWTQQPLTRGSHEVTFDAADRAGNRRTWNETVMTR